MFFESLWLNVTIALGLLISLTFDYVTKFFSYWYVRHIPYKTSIPFFGSDYHRVLGLRSTTEEVNELYSQYPKDHFVGCVKSRIPDLIIRDPDFIKKVLSTDFEAFQSRGLDLDKSQDVCLRNNLFYAEGENWKLLREGLESLLNDMTHVDNGLNDCLSGTNGDTNVQELLTKVLDVVFKKLLLDNVDGTIISEMSNTLQKRSIFDKLKSYLKSIFPSIYILLGLSTLSGQPSSKTIKTLKESTFMNKTGSILQLEVNGKNRKIKANPESFAFGILSTFITEGYIPCLNLLTALLFELSKNQLVQQTARNSNDYLDAVIKETLRLHPPFSVITRKCVETYKFPENDILIDKRVTVNVPVEAIHKDDTYYKEAEVFKPERFMDSDSSIHGFAYLPFGAGPRKCIGKLLLLFSRQYHKKGNQIK